MALPAFREDAIEMKRRGNWKDKTKGLLRIMSKWENMKGLDLCSFLKSFHRVKIGLSVYLYAASTTFYDNHTGMMFHTCRGKRSDILPR